MTSLVQGFDIKKFNTAFEEQAKKLKIKAKLNQKNKFSKLNQTTIQKPLYKLSIGEILVNTKDTWFDILDDLLTLDPYVIFTPKFVVKNHRLFYVGFTVVFICIVLYLYNLLITDDKTCQTDLKNEPGPVQIIKEHHYYYHNNDKKVDSDNSESDQSKILKMPEPLTDTSKVSTSDNIPTVTNNVPTNTSESTTEIETPQ
jgi:hypothetical protein